MTDKEVLKLALEALELHGKQYPHMVKGYCLDAITAIKQALAAPVQEPVAIVDEDGVIVVCNYKYKPGDKLYTTPPAAPPALVQQPATLDEMHAIGNGIMYGEQPAPVQEPVAIPDCGEAGHADGACGNRGCLPSFRRATPPAAPVKEQIAGFDVVLDESLPPNTMKFVQPVQPVAWVNHGENKITRATGWDGYGALYAAPPNMATPPAAQRQSARSAWVGLTDEEILKLAYPIRWQEVDDFEADKAVSFAQMVEAKLKEKNSV